MLEAVAAQPPKPAANPASATAARDPEKAEAGFQGMLREALDQPAEGDRAQNIEAAAKPVEPAGKDQTDASVAKAPEGITGTDLLGLSLPTEAAPSVGSGPAALEATLQLVLPMKDPATAAAQADQAAAQLIPSPDNALVAHGVLPLGSNGVSAQPLADQSAPPGKDAANAPTVQAFPATPKMNGGAKAAPTQSEKGADKAAPLALSGQAADVAAAATNNLAQQLEGSAAADAVTAPLPVAREALTKDQIPSDKALQETLANTLAAGPAQAAAGLVALKPQTAGSAAKPGSIASTEATLAGLRPAEAASRLAQAFNATEAASSMKLVMAPETAGAGLPAAETAEAGLHLASLEAPKTHGAKPSGDVRPEAISMLANGFAPTDGLPPRAEATLPSANTRELPAPAPARQLAPVVVSLALGRGGEALTIALDPVELGRVEVSIGQGKEAGQVRIVAERPETLALLQRDQRELDRALNQSGLGDMARSLSFSLASDQGHRQSHGSPHGRGQRASMTISGIEADRAIPTLPAPLRNPNALVDIAV